MNFHFIIAILLLCPFWHLFAGDVVNIYQPQPVDSPEYFCNRAHFAVTKRPILKFSRPMKVRHDYLLSQQLERVRTLYPKNYPEIEFTEHDFAEMSESDRSVPSANILYFSLNAKEKPDEIKGWMRLVTNWPHPSLHQLKSSNRKFNREFQTGVLPIETKVYNEGLSKFLDTKYPDRMEPGRLTTNEENVPGNRQAAFTDILNAMSRFFGAVEADSKSVLIAECESSMLEKYKALGFKEISKDEIRSVSPEFEGVENFHVIILPVSELQKNLKFDRYDSNLPNLDRALKRGVRQFDRIHFFINTNRFKEARERLELLRPRFSEDRDFLALELGIIIGELYDPVRNGGDAVAALKFLESNEVRSKFDHIPAAFYSEIGMFKNDVSRIEYEIARLRILTGDLDGAAMALRAIREKNLKTEAAIPKKKFALPWDRFQPRSEYSANLRVSSARNVFKQLRTRPNGEQSAKKYLSKEIERLLAKAPHGLSLEVHQLKLEALELSGDAEAINKQREILKLLKENLAIN